MRTDNKIHFINAQNSQKQIQTATGILTPCYIPALFGKYEISEFPVSSSVLIQYVNHLCVATIFDYFCCKLRKI